MFKFNFCVELNPRIEVYKILLSFIASFVSPPATFPLQCIENICLLKLLLKEFKTSGKFTHKMHQIFLAWFIYHPSNIYSVSAFFCACAWYQRKESQSHTTLGLIQLFASDPNGLAPKLTTSDKNNPISFKLSKLNKHNLLTRVEDG